MPDTTAVVHENIPLLEVADAVALDHILLDAAVAEAIVRRLSPTIAIVDPARLTAVIDRLRKLGHLPKVR